MTYERRVRLEDIDTAQIVFFARFYSYAHEAMELFFDGLDGTYVAYTQVRKRCFATVKLDAEFLASLRYGDTVEIEVTPIRLGTKSATLRYRFTRGDGTPCAILTHTVVSYDMTASASCEMPADARALFERHLEV